MFTRTQEKGAGFPQKAEPDVPVRVPESLAEAWVSMACHRVRGTERNSPGSPSPLA